jgi:hypothetical protein
MKTVAESIWTHGLPPLSRDINPFMEQNASIRIGLDSADSSMPFLHHVAIIVYYILN